jgi:GMP synthase (glutamine-hydrolysing)
MKTAVAIRHVAFEDLGAFAPALGKLGYTLRYHDVGLDDFAALEAAPPDVLFILGGPIGAYEEDRYPFLVEELALIGRRLEAGRATVGICLGAQLMARALGARVYPGKAKEIGFAPLTLSEAGAASCLRHLEGASVLHWHGDTFDLPAGALLLASTDITPHQAFAAGRHAVAFQFHPEAGGPGFECWLIGHTAELSAVGMDVNALRARAAEVGEDLARRAAACLVELLESLA